MWMMGATWELLAEKMIAYPPHPLLRDGASNLGTHIGDDDDDDDGEKEFYGRDIYLLFLVFTLGYIHYFCFLYVIYVLRV